MLDLFQRRLNLLIVVCSIVEFLRLQLDLTFHPSVIAASGACLMAMEVLVILVTCCKLWKTARQSREIIGSQTLSRVVLEGGMRCAVCFELFLISYHDSRSYLLLVGSPLTLLASNLMKLVM